MEILLTVVWILLGLPIIMFPMILLANVMSFAAPAKKNKRLKDYLFQAFLIVLTLYPVIYYFCYEYSKKHFGEGDGFMTCMYMLPPLLIASSLYGLLKK